MPSPTVIAALAAASLLLLAGAATAAERICPPTNLCFALDESGSIAPADFTIQANAVNAIVDQFATLSPQSAFSAVGFSATAELLVSLTTNRVAFRAAIMANPQTGRTTSSGAGLNLCLEQIRNAAQPRVVVLLSDGADNVNARGVDVAPTLKAAGITITTVGIGNGINRADLTAIATRPDLFVPVANFEALPTKINEIANMLCVDPTPTPSRTPSNTPSPSPKPRCATVDCARCGEVMECYVRSGSRKLDQTACRAVRQRKHFCRFAKATRCNQSCRCMSQGVKCYTGARLAGCPRVLVGKEKCRGGGYPSGSLAWRTTARFGQWGWGDLGQVYEPAPVQSVASYRVCRVGGRVVTLCAAQRCYRG